MKTEELTIQRKDALLAHQNAKSSAKKMLEDLFGSKTFQKDIMERIEDFDDVLAELKIKPSQFAKDCEALSADEVAYKQVKLIAQVLNEGWTPDWSNSNEYKYYPWFDMGSPSGSGFSFYVCDLWDSGSDCGSRLCYKSRKLAEFAGETFEAIYKDFLTA